MAFYIPDLGSRDECYTVEIASHGSNLGDGTYAFSFLS